MSTQLPDLPIPALRIQGNDLYNSKQLLQYAMDALAKQVSDGGHCKREGGCVCAGSSPFARERCGYWEKQ
ncbi:hypothetical protein [Variovorax sp. RCC_210]|uniref:hypothetical protein n=1 Tax=Variovorax sp. RCC_210 TaxID=3239217 RepID=UPI0035265066